MLQAASRIIERKLGKSAEHDDNDKTNKKPMAYSIKDANQFIFGENKDLDEAAKILRLLQIHNTRILQTSINEAIVSVQQITANPKTDTKLGKVGY